MAMSTDAGFWPALTEEILDYLSEHPDAADTPAGIALWWLQRRRYEESLTRVQRALNQLERQGSLAKSVLADGSVLYSAASLHRPPDSPRLDRKSEVPT
jgi:Fe2+ or Zn2+ uptake regulation protein